MSVGTPTDLVNIRNLDTNSLLRLYDRVKLAKAATRVAEQRDHFRRALGRIAKQLGRQGVRP